MEIAKIPFCKRVIFWGQFGPTCWFNAILMTVLYSQYSRHVVIEQSKHWDTKIQLFRLLKHVLKYKYLKTKNPEKDYKFFETMRPERILDMLKTSEGRKYLPNALDKGFLPYLFVSKLYKILGIDCLMLSVVDDNLYYDMYNHVHSVKFKDRQLHYEYKHKSMKYVKSKLNRLKHPPILIINTSDRQNKLDILKQHYDYSKHYKIGSPDRSLLDLQDTIIYNGVEYVLDSVLLANWNTSVGGHAIAGITCNYGRYVYNGWTRVTVDPAIKEKNTNMQDIPCELMKFEWSQNTNTEFCLNTKKCRLTRSKEKDYDTKLCFSFNKGERSLIYVKKETFANHNSMSSRTPDYRSYSQDKVDKECKEGKIRNPITNRCILLKNAVKKELVKQAEPIKRCPKGKVLNPETNRCIQRKKTVKKKCPNGKVRNPKTNRCVKSL